ncbi:MAG: RsmE family RNA methyltransferase [Limisphaerales bacterium]
MHRFLLPPEACRGDAVMLDEADSHHAARVLRLNPGDALEVLDGAGTRLACRLATVGRRAVTAAVEARVTTPAEPFAVTLALALLKGRALDYAIQKATELGARVIQPLAAERCVAQVAPDDLPAKLAGWRATAAEACKQCGNPWLPEIRVPRTVPELAPAGAGTLLVASLEPGGRRVADALAGRPAAVTVCLGPEGDFTPAEYAALRAAGALPVTLGPHVLRADTAAITALALTLDALRAGPALR